MTVAGIFMTLKSVYDETMTMFEVEYMHTANSYIVCNNATCIEKSSVTSMLDCCQ